MSARDFSLKMQFLIILALLLPGTPDFSVACPAQTVSLEEKLGATTSYLPEAETVIDRLVEVAQKYNIPMAVELRETARNVATDKKLPARNRTVRKLIEEIIGVTSDYVLEVDRGLLRIYSPTVAQHPFNFLNIRLDSYQVQDADLFEAEDRLRWAIRFTLEPEKYRQGWGGGYGYGSDNIFTIQKFSISGSDPTIREVLNQINRAQGNALWVATIKEGDLNGPEPFWKKKGADSEEGGRPLTSSWHFYPLSDIGELAREQIGVDIVVEGLLDQRINTIPVILEHGLTADGGATGISTSAGFSLNYSAAIDKIEKNSVTLLIRLTVRRKGEAEQKFDEKLQITKGEVAEFNPDARTRIRAYIEPREEKSRAR